VERALEIAQTGVVAKTVDGLWGHHAVVCLSMGDLETANHDLQRIDTTSESTTLIRLAVAAEVGGDRAELDDAIERAAVSEWVVLRLLAAQLRRDRA